MAAAAPAARYVLAVGTVSWGVGNNGRLIKTELAARVDRCIDFLKRDLMGTD